MTQLLPRAGAAVLLAATLAVLPGTSTATAASGADAPRTLLTRWSSTEELSAGRLKGGEVRRGKVRIGDDPWKPVTVRDTDGRARTMERARWVSRWVRPGFDVATVVPSWNAVTPKGTFVTVEMRTRSASRRGSWDAVATWAHRSDVVHRRSHASQDDDVARLLTDTVVANDPERITAWKIRVVLHRPAGTRRSPRLASAGAVAASYRTRSAATSATTMRSEVDLTVPAYSQMEHAGHHPQWDGGGEAWCSPTSTTMVLEHFGRGPRPREYAWTGEATGQVDHAARHTYDEGYDGTGNWSFNTAYAGQHRLDAFVTRLHSLRDAERFVRAGIPVVVSVAFDRGELSGAPLSSTPGHLMVIRGFTRDGRVIANDPAAGSAAGVRRVYDRGQLERAWLGGSGGLTYVMRRPSTPLPADSARW